MGATVRVKSLVKEIPINQIRRPLPRQNDPAKVAALMESIKEIGQQEPIDVLEVDGQYYGFSGCHRYEACQHWVEKQFFVTSARLLAQFYKGI